MRSRLLLARTGVLFENLPPVGTHRRRKQSLAEATIPVGGTVIEHFHKVTEEFYYILSGTGLMKIEDEVREVGPGDTVIIVPGQRHKITNNGQVPLVFLACCSPEWTAEDQVLVEEQGTP